MRALHSYLHSYLKFLPTRTQATTAKSTNMKFVVVFALCVAVALAAPADVEIIKSESENRLDGYKFAYDKFEYECGVVNVGKLEK